MINREAIFEALYTLIMSQIDSLSGIAFKKKSRFLKIWTDVGVPERPAIFLTKSHEKITQITNLPSVVTMTAKIWVYTYHAENTESPATLQNRILDGLEKCLMPVVPFEKQTLGGLVHHCFIDGDVIVDEGFLGNDAVMQVPITILTNV